MAEAKTQPTKQPVSAYLATVPSAATRADCATLVRMMQRVTGAPAVMWGTSIVGFGTYRYVYASGQSGDWPLAAFSPRTRELVLYVSGGFPQYAALMKRLGRCRTGKVCIYVKSLADLDAAVLEELVAGSVAHTRKLYPAGAAAAAAKRPAAATNKVVAKKATKKKAATKRAKR